MDTETEYHKSWHNSLLFNSAEFRIPDNPVSSVDTDHHDMSLRSYFKRNRISISEKLTLAIRLTQTVMNLHRTGLILHEITPDSFQVHPDTLSVTVSGTHEHPELLHHSITADSNPDRFDTVILPYYSPERTGRVGIKCDYRSAYYSLGTIFYELFTGTPPFVSSNPIEIIHSHIAVTPDPLFKKKRGVPYMVSEIVMKMLAKTPGDRYQSAFSIIKDLNRCLKSFQTHGTITGFRPGLDDVPEHLNFTEKIYGRDRYIEKLSASFERIRKGRGECIVVTGYPGTGKTSLIKQMGRCVKTKGGYFFSGKFDPIQTGIPYRGFTEAFRELIEQILMKDKHIVDMWRKRILDATGEYGTILARILPDIELITGKQPEGPTVVPADTGSRFNTVFEQFMATLAGNDTPLVMFLDDLQWADPASLDLICSLLSDNIPPFMLVICAFRSTSSCNSDTMTNISNALKKSTSDNETIPLGPLGIHSVENMLTDSLKISGDRCHSLSKLLCEKTGGNPFFIRRFLQSLYSEKHLYFDYHSGSWNWDENLIRLWNITRSAADLLTTNIKTLPDETLEILSLSACAGNRFHVDRIARAGKLDSQSLNRHLSYAVREGLILPVHQYLPDDKTPAGNNRQADYYEFLHDRIRQTTYGMIPDWKKKQFHLNIGRESLSSSGNKRSSNDVFYIADQMNKGADLINDDGERSDLTDLNLRAGILAIQSTAFQSAVCYCRKAIHLLPGSAWATDYTRTLTVYKKLAESIFLSGNIEKAESVFQEILTHSETGIDKSGVYNLMVILYTGAGRLEDALKAGLKGLRLFGVSLPKTTGRRTIISEIIKTISAIMLKGPSLKSLPDISDPETREVASLYANIGTPAYYINPGLFALTVIQCVRLSLKHGKSESFPFALISLGLIIGAGFGAYRLGARIADSALAFIKPDQLSRFNARSYFIYGFFIQPWKGHIRNSIRYMELACRLGISTGDHIYSGHSINAIFTTRLIGGERLDDLYDSYRHYSGFMQRLNDPFISGNYFDNCNLYKTLKEHHRIPEGDTGSMYETERGNSVKHTGNPLARFMFLCIRLRLYLLYDKHQAAMDTVRELETVESVTFGTLYRIEHCFLVSLCLASQAGRTGFSEKKKLINLLKQKRKQLKRWTSVNPENTEHKLFLVTAEYLRVTGKPIKACQMYQKAVGSPAENGFRQNTAMAYLRWSDFMTETGDMIAADAYSREAIRQFRLWGADGVVDYLTGTRCADTIKADSENRYPLTHQLDYVSLVNSLRAITAEMNTKALLKCILSIVMENAGAQRSMYISVTHDTPIIEAESRMSSETFYSDEPVPLEGRDDLLKEAVYYVKRSGNHVVLHNAEKEGPYCTSPYTLKYRPKSVLVLPMFRKTSLTGILYLENTITTEAFTPDRLKILRLIAAQSAISFENARLYETVRQKKQSLRRLSAKLLLAEEKERRKIAVGLHDRIGHALSNAKLHLSIARNASEEERNKRFSTVMDLISQSENDVQSLTFDLSPPVLYDFGLVAAIRWLSEKTSKHHGIPVDIEGPQEVILEESCMILLFQIVRELLFNAVKHSKADRITIKVNDGHRICISVCDNGKGFDVTATDPDIQKEGGFGLFSIRERLEHMGGTLTIDSEPDTGSVIKVSLETGSRKTTDASGLPMKKPMPQEVL